MTDLAKTDRRGRFREATVVVSGTASTGDYLGDTTNGEGVTVGNGAVARAYIHTQTADATGVSITVHNVTAGTSQAVTFASATFDTQGVDLHFDEGDELAVEITAVDGTTPAADGQITLVQEIEPAPMN